MSDPASLRWTLALRGAAVLAKAPVGLGGLVLHARAGPVRDLWIRHLGAISERPVHRLPASLDPATLQGGLDLTETLARGSPVYRPGLFAQMAGAILLVPMAERLPGDTAAQMALALDQGGADAPVLALLDESAEPDEEIAPALADRLGLHLSLEGIALGTAANGAPTETPPLGSPAGDPIGTLTTLAARCAIPSARVPAQAAAVARALARLDGERPVADRDLSEAAALSILPRARVMPDMTPPEDTAEDTPEPPPEPPPPNDPTDAEQPPNTTPDGPLEDRVLAAAAAILPDLALMTSQAGPGPSADAGAGGTARGAQRGRPVGTRTGRPERGNRLDVLASMRAAAPWQAVRRRNHEDPDRRIIVTPDDLRIKRFEKPAESVMIFVVDASGSAAAARMAEAKGAVELMLADAYQRREKVALIAFRGAKAEVLLEPTRALLQAKRRLAVLPGGGGTPLASALLGAAEMARAVRRRGATPFLIFLTDGKGNIALSGEPDRPAARADGDAAARALAADGVVTVLVDTATRPQAEAKALAATMRARYLPLPRADAHVINRAVRAATTPEVTM